MIHLNSREDKHAAVLLMAVVAAFVGVLVGGSTGEIVFSYATILTFLIFLLLGVKEADRRTSGSPYRNIVAVFIGWQALMMTALWYFHFQNPSYEGAEYVLGFPAATAVYIYGIWIAGMLLLALAYPLYFDGAFWPQDEADRFRGILDDRQILETGGDPETVEEAAGGDD